jgi:hypothetical protein
VHPVDVSPGTTAEVGGTSGDTCTSPETGVGVGSVGSAANCFSKYSSSPRYQYTMSLTTRRSVYSFRAV